MQSLKTKNMVQKAPRGVALLIQNVFHTGEILKIGSAANRFSVSRSFLRGFGAIIMMAGEILAHVHRRSSKYLVRADGNPVVGDEMDSSTVFTRVL